MQNSKRLSPCEQTLRLQSIFRSAFSSGRAGAQAALQLHAATDVKIVGNEVFDNSYGGIVVGADHADFAGGFGRNNHTIVRDNKVYRNGLLAGARGYGIEEYGAVGENNRFENNTVFGNRPADWNLRNKSLQRQLTNAR